jgi:hypothetical protein
MSNTSDKPDVKPTPKLTIRFFVAHLSLSAFCLLVAAVVVGRWWLTLICGAWLLISIWGFIDMRRSRRGWRRLGSGGV